jgi:hypothetical protein
LKPVVVASLDVGVSASCALPELVKQSSSPGAFRTRCQRPASAPFGFGVVNRISRRAEFFPKIAKQAHPPVPTLPRPSRSLASGRLHYLDRPAERPFVPAKMSSYRHALSASRRCLPSARPIVHTPRARTEFRSLSTASTGICPSLPP